MTTNTEPQAPEEIPEGDLPETSQYWVLRAVLRTIIEQNNGVIFVNRERFEQVKDSEEPFSFQLTTPNPTFLEVKLIKGE